MQKENRDRDNRPIPESAGSKLAPVSEPAPPEDFLRMLEWIRQAQTEAERAHRHAEPEFDDLQK
jgi:hypothetical protein